MKKRFVALAVALAMLALPVLARAETVHGFYLGVQGGLNYKLDRDFVYDPPTTSYLLDYKLGWGAGVTMGYGFSGTRNWFAYPRLELELTWRHNLEDNPLSLAEPFKFTSMATMANLLLDFDLGGKVYPYLGFGLGAATGWSKTSANASYDLQDTVFAYQGKAGLGFIVNDYLSLFAEYTYIRSMDFEQNNLRIDGMNDHSVMVGLRFAFGKPQSAPAPALAAPAAVAEPVLINSYMVFFDHDSSRIDSAASGTIAQAIAEFNTTGGTRIDVTGHTDTSGSSQYNAALSQRRAEEVSNALIAGGVPANAISIFSSSENDLLVPTADNVRERQNRRVFIYIYK